MLREGLRLTMLAWITGALLASPVVAASQCWACCSGRFTPETVSVRPPTEPAPPRSKPSVGAGHSCCAAKATPSRSCCSRSAAGEKQPGHLVQAGKLEVQAGKLVTGSRCVADSPAGSESCPHCTLSKPMPLVVSSEVAPWESLTDADFFSTPLAWIAPVAVGEVVAVPVIEGDPSRPPLRTLLCVWRQ